jgi:hypothetical protein
MNTWFIFTSTGGLATIKADNVSKAVASFRKIPKAKASEIVGVIRAAAQMERYGAPAATPVFGVICCVAEKPASQPAQ